jgi:hypothetical protein
MNIKRDCHESLRDPAISGALMTAKRRTPLAAGKSPNNGSIVV